MSAHQPEVTGTFQMSPAAASLIADATERATGGPTSMRRLLRRLEAIKHELGKFGVVGAVAYGVDNVVFLAFRLLFGEPLIAKVIAGVIATTIAFIGNRYWTWRNSPDLGIGRQYVLYNIINAVGLGIQLGCLGISHYGLGEVWPGIFRSVLADLISQGVLGMAFASAFRFWAYRRFVFLASSRTKAV